MRSRAHHPKEAIVLDPEGRVISAPFGAGRSKRQWNAGGLWVVTVGLLLPFLVLAGLATLGTLVAMITALSLVGWALRPILRLFGLR